MTVDYKIWNFPKIAIRSQLFHVPGSYFDGGFTSGGARMLSPEPGGRSVLEVTPSLQIGEWATPFSSWLMSKINGEIFKVPLVKTPQLVSLSHETDYLLGSAVPWDNNQKWDNNQFWDDDGAYLEVSSASLEGETSVSLEVSPFGEIVRHGHVIGFENHSYIVDDVEYENSIATISLKPPLRQNISTSDEAYLRPYFLGTIANGDEIRNSYEISNVGAIQLNRIIFKEVII